MKNDEFCIKSKDRIYFDHNATTPLSCEVLTQLTAVAECFGNPSSIHYDGRGPKTLLRDARNKIANLLNVHPLELIFTSGGSESNNLAIKGVYELFFKGKFKEKNLNDRPIFLFSKVEHPSVYKVANFLAEKGVEVDYIPTSSTSAIDLEKYQEKLSHKVAMVSCMLANNETGEILPIKKMAKMAHDHGAIFHCDAVQSLGKLNFDLKSLDVDMASFSGHKFYSLKGSGVLYVKKGTHVESLIHGGGQERNRRAGTENTLAIWSFGKMAEQKNEIENKISQIADLREMLESGMKKRTSGIKIIGEQNKRLSNTSCSIVEGVDGETLLMNLDMLGISISTGAACSSGSLEPSPTLIAMGIGRKEAQSSMRISLGWGTTEAEVNKFLDVFEMTVKRLRNINHRAMEYGRE